MEKKKMIMALPLDVKKIIERLELSGFEAYAVGGCVRDSLLGKAPDDWDICTSAKPLETAECFKEYNVIETGLKHGTVTVRFNHNNYEITTFRTDGEYLDCRRPENVQFTDSLADDLARRDFTINAMAYSEKAGLQDLYGGCEDLDNGIIRCVGNADERIGEDALRMMRALRFASVFGFTIEEGTSDSIHKNGELLWKISKERINTELCKLIMGQDAQKIMEDYTDIMTIIIPEIKEAVGFKQNNPHHFTDVWSHTLQALANAKGDLILHLAVLFHDIGKPKCYTEDEEGIGHFYGHGEWSAEMTRLILRDLKFDNNTTGCVCELVKYHDVQLPPNEKTIKRWLNKIGEEQFHRLLLLKRADIMGQSDYERDKKTEDLNRIARLSEKVIEERQCFSLKDLAVNGKDMIALGITEGKHIGESLNLLLEKVIDGELENKKEILENFVKSK